MAQPTKRILLKMSGQQLANGGENWIDPEFIKWMATEIKQLTEHNIQVVVVVGAGNLIRGAELAGNGISRTTADYLGMLSGVINGQVLMDIFQYAGLPTRVMSSIHMEQICEPYIRRKAVRHLEKGRVVIVSGGTGRPYVTHDSAGVFYALELDCEVMIKASDVDGIYDKDPNTHDDATHLPTLSFQDAMESPDIKVMDKSALGLAMEQKLPLVVYNIKESGALLKIALGEAVGTRVS